MSLEKIGAVLKQERQKQNISVDEISQATRISRAQIRAIEVGESSKLPARVYVRGFIRSYAKVLGVDTKALLELFGPVQLTQLEPAQPIQIDQGVNKYFTLTHILLSSAIVFFLSFIVWMRGALRDYETAKRTINSASSVEEKKKQPQRANTAPRIENQKADIKNNPAYLKHLEQRMKKHLPKGVKIKFTKEQKASLADKAPPKAAPASQNSVAVNDPPAVIPKKIEAPSLPSKQKQPPSVMFIEEGFGSAVEPSWERQSEETENDTLEAESTEERNF